MSSVNTDLSNILIEVGYDKKWYRVPSDGRPRSPWAGTAVISCDREYSEFDRNYVYFPVDNTKIMTKKVDPQVLLLRCFHDGHVDVHMHTDRYRRR